MNSYKIYCVYHQGLASYTSKHLTNCLRYVAQQLRGNLSNTTVKKVSDAGYLIKLINY